MIINSNQPSVSRSSRISKMSSKSLPWMNKQLLRNIVRESENDDSIEMISLHVEPGTAEGVNYTSDIYRIIVHYSHVESNKTVEKNISVIFKVMHSRNEALKKAIKNSGMFDTEISMLMSTLKEMNAVLGNEIPLSGKGLYADKEEPIFIVIEDLVPMGFQLANCHDGLDLQHCKLAVQGLARFHASSIAVCEKNPKLKKVYRKGMFSEEEKKTVPSSVKYYNDNVKALAAAVASWPEINPKYADKVLKISDKIYDLAIRASEPQEGEFNVINHGDFSTNNMLFRYDNSGRPNGHVMVDFQHCKYTSPVVDLLYFRYLSMSDEVFDNHENAVLEEYHETLCRTMEEIGTKTKPLSLEELHQDLHDRAVLGMIVTFTLLPLSVIEKDKMLLVDEILSRSSSITPDFFSPRFRQIMMKRLPLFEKMGLLDL